MTTAPHEHVCHLRYTFRVERIAELKKTTTTIYTNSVRLTVRQQQNVLSFASERQIYELTSIICLDKNDIYVISAILIDNDIHELKYMYMKPW